MQISDYLIKAVKKLNNWDWRAMQVQEKNL